MPRALVIDLWGSATLAHRRRGDRAGAGADGLPAELGSRHRPRAPASRCCRCAAIGRPRVDVTWRISGLFRDLFPAQIALLDAAVRAVAARDETDDENPLAARAPAQRRRRGARAHLRHRARRLRRGRRRSARPREPTATTSARPISPPPRTPMAAPTATATHAPGAFAAARRRGRSAGPRRATIPARDLLEGAEDAAFVGGFAAAAATLGRNPDLVMLDMTDPQRPRARPLSDALARIVRARADQSALHRRPDAARPARRRRIRRDRRPPGRFRRDDRRGAERAARSRARRLSRRCRRCATS